MDASTRELLRSTFEDALPSRSDAPFFAAVVADYDAVVPEWEMRPPPRPSE